MTSAIRPMSGADIGAVTDLEREIFPQPWSPGLFRDELAQENRRYVVAEHDGEIVAYAGLLLMDEDAHITTIAVAESGRRRRLGSRLLLTLVEEALAGDARHLTLEVRASNVDAQRLYERFGFTRVGKRTNYYRDEDAVVMWATSIDSPEYEARITALRRSLEEPR